MAKGYNRIGPEVAAENLRIDIEEAERIRNIGVNLMLSDRSTKHFEETSISASLVADSSVGVYNYRPEEVSYVYGYVEEESLGDDSWRVLLKYNSYRDLDGGLFGLESAYEVNVIDGRVILALCGLQRLRDTRDIKVRGREIFIEQMEKRVGAEVPLTSDRIDNLEVKVKKLLGRANSQARNLS
jgi:hypothetical protein